MDGWPMLSGSYQFYFSLLFLAKLTYRLRNKYLMLCGVVIYAFFRLFFKFL